ncbi:MAG: FliM/FliN family flagellar motor switch protein [Phycisphaeraceae bacterium]|nr:FliM/FliN family flagellar motor switch protein [Phycisphaeraceae bacterium]
MATDLQTILKLSVPVIVQVGQQRMMLSGVLGLSPGVILELEKPVEEELDLLVNNKPIGKGTAVKVGENFGVRVTKIGSPQERVEALGQ